MLSHLPRYRQIAEILARHGLGYLAGALGLERLVPLRGWRAWLGRAESTTAPSRPEHVRLALEELGPTFVKLGQIVSTRPDLLPPEYVAELAKLQDAAPSVPASVIRERVESELQRPLDEVFASFDLEPLATGSIGQAHAATLLGPGAPHEVVVKVRRPGVVEQIEEDLTILHELAVAASRRWPPADEYDVIGLAQEFAQTLRAELDYIREGRSAEHFAASFAHHPRVHIPRVYWEATTPRVLTLERVRGIKISDQEALAAAGVDRRELAEVAANVILKMVFEDGFFHADPHPGNFFVEVMPRGNGASAPTTWRLGLIDFGMVGLVDERTQEQLVRVLLAVTSQDAERLTDTLLELGFARRRINRAALRRDLEHLVSRYYGQPLGEIKLGPLLEDALAVVRRYHLQLPPNLALLFKTAIMNEGLGAQLDPHFRLTQVLVPYAERLVLRQYSPLRWIRPLGRAGLDAVRLGADLPGQARRIIGELERGGLEMGVRPEGFEPVIQRLERLVNRLVLSILAAAFVIGLAVLMAAYRPALIDQLIRPLFAVGFTLATALGIYLAWAVLRSGRA